MKKSDSSCNFHGSLTGVPNWSLMSHVPLPKPITVVWGLGSVVSLAQHRQHVSPLETWSRVSSPQVLREQHEPQGTKILRESFPRQVDRESRGPQGERGLEFSRRKKGQTFFLYPHSLGLYNNNVSCLRTVFGLNLLANSVILKCKLWESV